MIDVRTGEIVCEGLSMPHSPRLHHGRLWLLDSGTGQFGHVDPVARHVRAGRLLPGLRARPVPSSATTRWSGLSKPRGSRTFADLELGEQLTRRGAEPRCGLMVIDLRSGDIVHWLRLDGIVEELYDVAALPGVRQPMALGLQSDEIQRTITIGDPSEAR